ncbi:MAG: ABC transporter ATP-binding protein [Proteobacteria bacterium]|nr:ABC transporter ATP-binding protein [Pseudomonadota bacterium]
MSLRLKQLKLRAGAPSGIDHEFADGELTVVLGRHHSGKSALCRLIAGLDAAPAGSLFIDGIDISGLNARLRPVAMVFQAFVNYPNWTVEQNLASPLRARHRRRGRDTAHHQGRGNGGDAQAVARRVRMVAESLQIDLLLDRYPHELSGGQQQRVAIGRALAQDAAVLVLDEPLVNLDYKLREELEGQLRTLTRQTRQTVIYTSSDPLAAFALGDRVLLLKAGEYVQSGRPVDVYSRPVSLVAADLMSDPGVNLLFGPDHWLAVRPEHLSFKPPSADATAFPATIVERETNGSETFVHCRCQDENWVVRSIGVTDAVAGAAATLYADPANVMRFER